MYTRSYNEEREELSVPDGYSGTALPFGVHNTNEQVLPPPEEKPVEKKDDAVSAGIFGNLFSTPMLKGIFGNLLSGWSFGLSHIGTEEILIIATAAFLFFSGDGDRECAILLLLLLFIN